MFCVSCDMPRFSQELAAAMLEAFPRNADAMVCVDSCGQVHPLCAIYARTVLPTLEQHLRSGDLRMMRLLEELHTARFEIAGHFPDEILLNINTPEAFAALPEKGADHD